MSAPAVRASAVSKLFHRGERHDSLRDLIPAMARRLRGRRPSDDDRIAEALAGDGFWAVRDVSFDVPFGRALGIIGPNGAGKSTMLKLLTGILRPTKGEIRMRGRVASLIEVAAGFHQDLTGRENVYLQGAIMGMTRREIDRRLDSIIDFSGIEPFIDTPVKRYSSGMNARLGFAIAVHVEPDILVIDEVLSVGDMAFQQRCVDRMKAFKQDGVAIVFVSHNMQAVGDLCDEALVVKGTVRHHGRVGDAVACYLKLVTSDGEDHSKGEGVTMLGARVADVAGQPVDAVAPHTSLHLDVDVRIEQDLEDQVFSMVVRRATDAFEAADGSITSEELGLGRMRAGSVIRLRFAHDLHLARGQYAYEFNVFDRKLARHRLIALPVAAVRVDEYSSYSGIADCDVQISARDVVPDEVYTASVAAD
jgi:ABC-type polysaccharide/polyol phosphate transport system ATPase subunit